MLVSMGVMTVVMGATAASLESGVRRCNNAAMLMTGVNNSLRTGMDLMIRDMLQIGSGLPTGPRRPDSVRHRRGADEHSGSAGQPRPS